MSDVSTFMVISRRIVPEWRKILDQSCREDKNRNFVSSTFFFRKSCRDNYEKYGSVRQVTDNRT